MFEDTKEPVDMFEATDKAAPQITAPTDAPVVSRVASAPSASMVVSEKHRGLPWKVILLVFGILVVIAAVFLLSMKILGSKTPSTPKPPVMQESQTGVVEKIDEREAETMTKEEAPLSRMDTDKDGLTDEEEQEYGTSIHTADTDADGLFDLEEIRIWKTDPLNPDSDGDGYLDGEEVNALYNPNGEGVLREAPTESS